MGVRIRMNVLCLLISLMPASINEQKKVTMRKEICIKKKKKSQSEETKETATHRDNVCQIVFSENGSVINR